MKRRSLLLSLIYAITTLLCQQYLFAQDPPIENPRLRPYLSLDRLTSLANVPAELLTKPRGQFSTQDWATLIDSVWGPGLPTSDKLTIFDFFVSEVRTMWSGFPNLSLNFDSLVTAYRARIEAGVSRGRFAAITSHLSLALLEDHTRVEDGGIVDACTDSGALRLRRGVPLMILGDWGANLGLGAGVTPLPDSTLLVYRSVPGNPLGLMPGDLVLGYDRVPWKTLVKNLWDAELPVAIAWSTPHGSDPVSLGHSLLAAAGLSYHLFDTIDIAKYPSNDTIHLSTAPLLTAIPRWDTIMYLEQIPVAGVPYPRIHLDNQWVKWGIVNGTNIGYIYIVRWNYADTVLLRTAMEDLLYSNNISGLIVDFRFNQGGYTAAANVMLRYLFNEDPSINCFRRERISPEDPFGFSEPIVRADYFFNPNPDLYDRPIAVLTGPYCYSAGDHNAFRLRFHPTVRFFGKRASTAYVQGQYSTGTLYGNWDYILPTSQMWSNLDGEGFMIHKGFNVDEEVWLTRDDAAAGVDHVVKTAIDWINNTAYAHNLTADSGYVAPGSGVASISASIENPNSHTLAAKAYVRGMDDTMIDSVDLAPPLNPMGQTWKGTWNMPSCERNYKLSITTTDHTTGETFPSLPLRNCWRITSTGPALLDSLAVVKSSATQYQVKFYFRNDGDTAVLSGLNLMLDVQNPWVTHLNTTSVVLPSMNPGAVVTHASAFLLTVDSSLFRGYFDFAFTIASNGWPYWKSALHQVLDSVRLTTSPQGAWIWGDQTDTITWDHMNLGNVRIELSTNDGITWPIPIAARVPADDRKLVWIVPDINCQECKLRISDAMRPGINNVSGPFSIFRSRIVVNNRWNMVSVPHHLPNYQLDDVYPTHTSNAYCFTDHYVSEDTLEHGCGYWLKFGEAETVHLIGEPVLAETIDVHDGWNLVGSLSVPVPVAAIMSDPPEMITSSFYEYIGAYVKSETIEPGRGYWIKSDGSGLLFLDASGGSGRGFIKRTLPDVPPPPPDGEISGVNSTPKTHALHQNYPNPSNPSTVIRYELPLASHVTLKLYNILGQELSSLVDEIQEAGYKSVKLDGSKLPSGVYFYRLVAGSYVDTKKMVLMR